jgi:hypothetical protein
MTEAVEHRQTGSATTGFGTEIEHKLHLPTPTVNRAERKQLWHGTGSTMMWHEFLVGEAVTILDPSGAAIPGQHFPHRDNRIGEFQPRPRRQYWLRSNLVGADRAASTVRSVPGAAAYWIGLEFVLQRNASGVPIRHPRELLKARLPQLEKARLIASPFFLPVPRIQNLPLSGPFGLHNRK